MKIYTKTGDKGMTSLFDGRRVKKFHPRVETYGTIDELNSNLGVIIAEIQGKNLKFKNILEKIQNDLLDIGSYLANPSVTKDAKLSIKLSKNTAEFEKFIDEMTGKMPILSNFILPGGSKVGSLLHVARSVVRRVERRIVELAQDNDIEKEVLIYFNRLSDLFFTMSRFANFKVKKKEIIWTRQ